MHVAVWGSMLSWFVVIPITSSSGFYGVANLFLYNGVAYEVISSAVFWFYLFLATVIALLPTISFRICRLNLFPNLIDDVRLKQKQEGRTIFRRRLFHRKPPPDLTPVQRRSIKRTGYAFSHQEGFGEMITTGKIFGLNENEIEEEHHRRLSQLIISRSHHELAIGDTLLTAAEASLSTVTPPVVTIEVMEESKDSGDHVETKEQLVKEATPPVGDGDNVQMLESEKEEVISNTGTEEVIIAEDPGEVPLELEEGNDDDGTQIAGGTEGGVQDETDSILTPGKFRINLPGSVDSPEETKEEEESKSTEEENT